MGCTERVLENGKVVERDCHTKGKPQAVAANGPGTELKALLKTIGINATLGCSCNAMAHRMNAAGPDWCEGPGLPEILAAMKREHEKRRKARRTILPWIETGAKFLVRLACHRARARA